MKKALAVLCILTMLTAMGCSSSQSISETERQAADGQGTSGKTADGQSVDGQISAEDASAGSDGGVRTELQTAILRLFEEPDAAECRTAAELIIASRNDCSWLCSERYQLRDVLIDRYDGDILLVCDFDEDMSTYEAYVVYAFCLGEDGLVRDSQGYGGLEGSIEQTEDGGIYLNFYDESQGWTGTMDGLIQLEKGSIVFPERKDAAEQKYSAGFMTEDGTWDTSNVDISWIDPEKKLVAFTFDDGPTKNYTSLLNILEQYGMHATFFVWGRQYNSMYEDVMKRVVEDGCEFGNHTWSHPYLTKLEPAEIQDEIEKTRALLESLTGIKDYLVRPPYGSSNGDVMENVNVPMINWSLDTADWNNGTYESVYTKLTENIQDGDIVLMHASYAYTVEAVRDAIPVLIEQGYQVVSVSELCAVRGKTLEAGRSPLNTRVK